MKIAIIGRTEVLYSTMIRLREAGHKIVCIITAKEAPEYTRTAADFRDLASAWKVPFAQGGRIQIHADLLQDSQADIAVSVNYTGLLPQSVINLFPLGVLNAHGGDLPRYRGNACQAWAILNGEDRIGLCIHKMIGDELDAGDIIARDYLEINYTTKISLVWDWILLRTPDLMLGAVQMLGVNPEYILEKQSKDPTKTLRCYPRKPEDGCIKWTKSALNVLRLINASNKPYSGAYCFYKGEKIVIWDAELVEDNENYCAIPGQVTKIGNGYVEVVCGEGKLRINLIQLNADMLFPSSLITSLRDRLS